MNLPSKTETTSESSKILTRLYCRLYRQEGNKVSRAERWELGKFKQLGDGVDRRQVSSRSGVGPLWDGSPLARGGRKHRDEEVAMRFEVWCFLLRITLSTE
jgi:hypothetical protein